jgi:hypothetical protein
VVLFGCVQGELRAGVCSKVVKLQLVAKLRAVVVNAAWSCSDACKASFEQVCASCSKVVKLQLVVKLRAVVAKLQLVDASEQVCASCSNAPSIKAPSSKAPSSKARRAVSMLLSKPLCCCRLLTKPPRPGSSYSCALAAT